MITYPLNNILYQAEDAELFHCTRSSGVFTDGDFSYLVTGADNNITIQEGIGWIRNSRFSGKVVALKSAVMLELGISDSLYSRIDAVVIRFDATQNRTEIVIKQGTAGPMPTPPEVVRTESLYELHIYHVLRQVGSVTVTPSDITDVRLNSEYCGLMADSVTSIDTSAIWAQIDSLIKGADERIDESIKDHLQEAKDSGEFDGVSVTKVEQTQTSTEDGGENEITVTLSDSQSFKFVVKNGTKGGKGDKGVGVLSTVLNEDFTLTINLTDGTSYTTPSIRGEIGKTGNGIKSAVLNADYTLTLTFTDNTTYTTPSIRGAKGADGVSITSVSQTTTASGDGGANVITVSLSNGQSSTFQVKNGTKGTPGAPGTTDFNQLQNKPTAETWTFTLEDGSTVTKAVYVG